MKKIKSAKVRVLFEYDYTDYVKISKEQLIKWKVASYSTTNGSFIINY